MFREWFNGSTGGGGRFARSVPDLAPPMTPGGVIRYASLGVVPASCLLQSSQAVRLCFSLFFHSGFIGAPLPILGCFLFWLFCFFFFVVSFMVLHFCSFCFFLAAAEDVLLFILFGLPFFVFLGVSACCSVVVITCFCACAWTCFGNTFTRRMYGGIERSVGEEVRL